MFEESRENTGGVIAGMLRSLEDGHLDIVPSAELKKAELAASPANNSSDEVLEMAGDFNYDGYQVVRRECRYWSIRRAGSWRSVPVGRKIGMPAPGAPTAPADANRNRSPARFFSPKCFH